MRLRSLVAAVAALAAFAGGQLVDGQGALAGGYYAGKDITLYAGYPPGGGVDSEMRLVAHYFGAHIPGHPNIVAKNMPGAGGLVLGNYLYAVAPHDGTEIGMPGRSGFLLANSIGQPGAKYDLTKFVYIGSAVSTNSTLWLRKDVGVHNLDELRHHKKPIVLGGLTTRSQNIVVPKVLAKYEGFPFRLVHGYPGFNAVLIAMERGEVDGLFSHEGSIEATRPDMIEAGKVIPIFQTFPVFPNVPVMDDFVTNPKEKALLTLMSAPSRVGLPLLGPPGMNTEATKVLRKAYQEMAKSKDFKAAAAKRGLDVTTPNTGEELEAYIAKHLVKVDPDVVKEYLAYTKRDKSKKRK